MPPQILLRVEESFKKQFKAIRWLMLFDNSGMQDYLPTFNPGKYQATILKFPQITVFPLVPIPNFPHSLVLLAQFDFLLVV
jgi:hypothetical protein